MCAGFIGSNTGTHEALSEAGTFIEVAQKRQGIMVACPEEIAFQRGWIGANRVDMLVEIKLIDGGNELVLCHMEIQGEGGDDLPGRMMRHRDAIHLYYRQEPVGIVASPQNVRKAKKLFTVRIYLGSK